MQLEGRWKEAQIQTFRHHKCLENDRQQTMQRRGRRGFLFLGRWRVSPVVMHLLLPTPTHSTLPPSAETPMSTACLKLTRLVCQFWTSLLACGDGLSISCSRMRTAVRRTLISTCSTRISRVSSPHVRRGLMCDVWSRHVQVNEGDLQVRCACSMNVCLEFAPGILQLSVL